MSRTEPSRFQRIFTILIIALAVRALFGDAIGAFLDGMYIGFTDGI
ncbi:hypothetical protein [Brevundimonas sp.]|nr:hypothetical protein [Brevundimonas sp.]